MAEIRGYMASSLDGYIASPDGGIEWLRPFEQYDYGYDDFIAAIRTVVMGRITYAQSLELGPGWMWPGRRGIVVTSKALAGAADGVVAWRGGVDALIDHLRSLDDGDAWIVGGAALQLEFLRRGALDRLEWTIVPVMIGDGIRLFPVHEGERAAQLAGIRALPGGMVQLDYRFGGALMPPAGAGNP